MIKSRALTIAAFSFRGHLHRWRPARRRRRHRPRHRRHRRRSGAQSDDLGAVAPDDGDRSGFRLRRLHADARRAKPSSTALLPVISGLARTPRSSFTATPTTRRSAKRCRNAASSTISTSRRSARACGSLPDFEGHQCRHPLGQGPRRHAPRRLERHAARPRTKPAHRGRRQPADERDRALGIETLAFVASPGLHPGVQVFVCERRNRQTWMAGSSPARRLNGTPVRTYRLNTIRGIPSTCWPI